MMLRRDNEKSEGWCPAATKIDVKMCQMPKETCGISLSVTRQILGVLSTQTLFSVHLV
jgi:hypothetical protein